MNRQELSAASSIGLLYLIRMLGLFMVLPVLPVVAPEIAGATPLLIGLAIGIYGLSQGLLQIPFGLLSDVVGRKPVIVGGLLLFIAGSFVAGFSESIEGVVIGRFLQGCGAIASSLLALMSDLTRVDQRGKSMAIVGIAIGTSFGLSLVLGPLIGEAWGISGVFNLTGALGILGLVVLVVMVPTPSVRTRNLDSSLQRSRLEIVLRDMSLWRLNISVFSLHFLLISAFSVFPYLFEGTGEIQTEQYAYYYLSLLIASFLLMLPFMRLFDRMPDGKPILLAMVAFCVAAFMVLASFTSFLMILTGVALFFMAFNLLEVVLPAQLSKISTAGSRGTAMGIYTTCQFLGIFAGGLVSGLILTLGDAAMVMYANAGLSMLWLLMMFGFPKLGKIGSRTVQLQNLAGQPDNARIDALLSIDGVMDAVVIEADQVAYLKVDEQTFNDNDLHDIAGGTSNE